MSVQRFSSVVGPNGSGKSNVIDAMLFVFGKKAKQLRLNKISELIHKSEAYMDLPMCRVSVHFVEIHDKVCNSQDQCASHAPQQIPKKKQSSPFLRIIFNVHHQYRHGKIKSNTDVMHVY